jgi:hypothetical protein
LKIRGWWREPAENSRAALHQREHQRESDHACNEPGDGGRASSRKTDSWAEWIAIASDLDSARAAGCTTAEQTARYLCPWALPVDNIRDRD